MSASDGGQYLPGRALAAFHDELWDATGLPAERTVLGGFSMGSVMSYALGLGGDRPAPRGILAFSGFVPTVEGWQPQLEDRRTMNVFIAHGRGDHLGKPISMSCQREDRGSRAIRIEIQAVS